MADRQRGERDIHRELRLHPVAKMAAGRADGKSGMLGQEARSSPVAGSAPVAPEITAAWSPLIRRRQLRPTAAQRCRRSRPAARLQRSEATALRRAIGCCAARSAWLRGLRSPGRRRASRAQSRDARARSQTGAKRVFQIEAAEFVEQQQILALAVVRAADQRDVTLAGRRCARRRSAPRRRRRFPRP